ncbi:hypothetical protein OLEAN_C19670 [Oleispira antarctica RB-8]|uniref:Uncharacterized protein n=1 Tax=Oleispira antarctica RB-8 TaxID=698738 RepID=R4YS96_OLEAN|nr:hypothetical protein OLEAN_C19670 [Oleispira antarctica RB-8]
MKKIYLHIGPHKTGTTFLQKIFQDNIELLRENDIDYLEFGKQYLGHHEMAAFLNQKKYEKDEIKSAIDKSLFNKILISSENFDALHPYALEFLKAELREFDVEILVSYRTPTARLYSWWQEEVKHGDTRTYAEYITPHYSKPYASHVLNINNCVKLYADNFGEASIRFFDYEWCIENGGVFDAFIQYLRLEGEFKISAERVNNGLSVTDVEIIRTLNSLAREKGELDVFNVRDAYLKKWNRKHIVNIEIQTIQQEYAKSIFVGNSFIDKILKKALLDIYQPNFVTGISSNYKEKSILMPESTWISDPIASEKITYVYNEIMG